MGRVVSGVLAVKDSDDAFAARLTQRLRSAIHHAVRGGIVSYLDAHPAHDVDVGSLAKRVTGQIWNVFKTHPDVRARHGKFPDEIIRELEACRTECAKKSAQLITLRVRGVVADESYDDRQVAAPLVTCVTCGRRAYMTAPSPECAACLESRAA